MKSEVQWFKKSITLKYQCFYALVVSAGTSREMKSVALALGRKIRLGSFRFEIRGRVRVRRSKLFCGK